MDCLKRFYAPFILLGLALMVSCSRAPVESTSVDSTQPTDPPPTITSTATEAPPTATGTARPPSPTLSPTATMTASPQPTDTVIPSPTATGTPTFTPAQAQSGIYGGSNTVQVYFILLNTGGPIACGDSLLSVGSGVPKTGDVAKDILGALKKLFSYKTRTVGGMYNPLYRSNIKVDTVKFDQKTGLITVRLTGKYVQPDDPCDNKRVRDMVWYTVRQYPEIKSTNIYMNSYPFGDKLSNGK